jgi:hypothetical protein
LLFWDGCAGSADYARKSFELSVSTDASFSNQGSGSPSDASLPQDLAPLVVGQDVFLHVVHADAVQVVPVRSSGLLHGTAANAPLYSMTSRWFDLDGGTATSV